MSGLHGHAIAGTTNTSLGTIHDDIAEGNEDLAALTATQASALTQIEAIVTALGGSGSLNLTSGTVTSLQTAFTTANEGIRTDLTTIADDLNSILAELIQKIEAGEDVGLTEDAINTLATAIATLFHYPTDYPSAQANTDATSIKTKLDSQITALAHLTDNTQTTKITNGTQAADTIAGDSGQNSLLVAPSRKELSGLSAGALNADLVPSTDVINYKSWSLHVLGTYVGTLTFQGSNDNTNWASVNAEIAGSTASPPVTATGTNLIYSGQIKYRYLRVRMTAYTSGTATGVLELSSQPTSQTVIGTSLPSATALADGAANPTTAYIGADNMLWNGTTWDRIRGAVTSKDTAGTGLLGVGNQIWDSVNSLWRNIRGDSAGNLFSKITNGTQEADTSAGDSGFNGLITTTGIKTTAINSATVVVDCAGYPHVAVQLIGSTFNVTGQQSNDNSTWVNCPNASPNTATPTLSVGANVNTAGHFIYYPTMRYFRIAYTSGTVTGSIVQRSAIGGLLAGVSYVTGGTVSATQGTAANFANAWPVYAGNTVNTTNILGGVSVTTTGAANSLNAAYGNVTMQVVIGGTGSFTNLSVVLEGSIDGGSNWFTLATFTTTGTTGGAVFSQNQAVSRIRARTSVFTVASGTPTVTAYAQWSA